MKYALSLLAMTSALLVMPAAAFGQQASEAQEPALETMEEPVLAAQNPKRTKGFSMYIDLGFAYRRLYDASIVGGELALGIGGTGRTLGLYGTLGLAAGTTIEGLSMKQFDIGMQLLFPVSKRLRLGLEPRITQLFIERATTGTVMGGGGLGFYGNAMFDVVQFDSGALYTNARLGVEPLPGSRPTAILWGGTLSFGYRY